MLVLGRVCIFSSSPSITLPTDSFQPIVFRHFSPSQKHIPCVVLNVLFCPTLANIKPTVGGGFKYFSCSSLFGGRFPIWRSYFSDGLDPPGHQLANRFFPRIRIGSTISCLKSWTVTTSLTSSIPPLGCCPLIWLARHGKIPMGFKGFHEIPCHPWNERYIYLFFLHEWLIYVDLYVGKWLYHTWMLRVIP